MSNDKLACFRGWRDGCNDCADFLETLSNNASPELKVLVDALEDIAVAMRGKGRSAFAMAEKTQETEQ